MQQLADLIAELIADWNANLEQVLFDTTNPNEIARLITAHIEAVLTRPTSALLYSSGVGVVAGLELTDGRRVVIKVHRANVDRQRLLNVQRAQTLLADRGLPAPRPLSEPTPIARGLATVEELLPGDDADGHAPAVRTNLASTLCAFHRAARSLPALDVGTSPLLQPPAGALWPEPHSIRFDFAATARGAEWIDAHATRARRALMSTPYHQPIVAHMDWRAENLGFRGHEIIAIFDWDALAVADEAAFVGVNAAQFCANWRLDHPLPSVDEMRAFVDDYEAARGSRFDRRERVRLDAANLSVIAYGARCQHSDMALYPELVDEPSGGWIGLLRAREAEPVWA